MTDAELLRRAAMWIGILIRYVDVDPEEFWIEVVEKDAPVRRVTLAEDLMRMDNNGAPTREHIWAWDEATRIHREKVA